MNWNKLANADSYDVYAKKSNDSDYYFVINTIDTTKSISVNLSTSKKYSFKVLGKNKVNRSNPITAIVVTAKDDRSPRLTSPSLVGSDTLSFCFYPSNLLYSGTHTVYLDFNEYMDTTGVPVLTRSNPNADLVYTTYWSDPNSLMIQATIPAGKTLSNYIDLLTVNLSGLKDNAGNLLNDKSGKKNVYLVFPGGSSFSTNYCY